MKQLLMLGMVWAVACNSSQKTTVASSNSTTTETDPTPYAQTITEGELKTHLYTYASDEFEGRETGQPGQKKAVAYLKAEYEKLGIPAAQGNGNYFQKVPLEISKLPTGSITVNGQEYSLGTHLLTFSRAMGTYTQIVYVGYGIEDKDYSDYKGLNVKDKLVLVKAGEPKNKEGTYLLSGSSKPSVWSNMSESITKRIELAASKGAKGILIYDDANYQRYTRYFDYMKVNDRGKMELKNKREDSFMTLYVDADLAKNIFPAIDSDSHPKNLQTSLSFNIESSNTEVDSENVAAIIKGAQKPDEYVIVSAHLDHIGISKDGQINNGADDDGSGTVALLEIAEAFKKAADEGHRPKRSIVFLHVTGEEKGLLGSQYYTDMAPLFPLSQTVADLNVDMIGRVDPKHEDDRNYIYLIGSDKLSTQLHELSEEVNKKYTHLELDYTYNDENDPNRFYYRSDHYNFAKNNIPIIFYFNGTHEDYHKPGDTPDKISYDLLEKRAQLIFYTAWEVANRDQRLVVDKPIKQP